MQLYWRHKRLCALLIEFDSKLGTKPWLRTKRLKKELIIEFPFGYAIITPKSRMYYEYPAKPSREKDGMRKHEKRDPALSTNPQEASGN